MAIPVLPNDSTTKAALDILESDYSGAGTEEEMCEQIEALREKLLAAEKRAEIQKNKAAVQREIKRQIKAFRNRPRKET